MNDETLYARWLSGDLSPAEIESLRKSGELEELERIARATENLSLPEYDLDAAYQKLQQRRERSRPAGRKISLKWPLRVAAAVLLLIAVSVAILRNSDSELSTMAGENLAHTFEDGSEVILNDGSSVAYSDRSWGESRDITLTGEAFFSVEKGVPFIVATSTGSVEVLGTEFSVRARGENLYVECYEGSVRVTRGNRSTDLVPGQSVLITQTDMREASFTHTEPLWTQGISRFFDEPLGLVLEELELQYGVKVTTEVTARSFEGGFSHDDLEQALREICRPLGLKFTISVDGKSVSITE